MIHALAGPPVLRARAMAVTVLATAYFLAGCTSGKSDSSATKGASSSGPQVTAVRRLPTKVPNSAERRTRVQITSCAGTDKKWTASGVATNPDKKAATYTITVYFTTPKATVVNYAQTKVNVPASGRAEWKAEATFATIADMRCVLVGVA